MKTLPGQTTARDWIYQKPLLNFRGCSTSTVRGEQDDATRNKDHHVTWETCLLSSPDLSLRQTRQRGQRQGCSSDSLPCHQLRLSRTMAEA